MSHITASAFHDALLAAGVVTKGERIRRIVIDAQAGHAVILYVERYGDERLIEVVAPGLTGVEVREVNR